MEILVGQRSPDSKRERIKRKFLELSDKIGDMLYNRKPINKENIITSLKRKKEQFTPKKQKTVNLIEFAKNFLKKKEPRDTTITDKRRTGMIILTGMILIVITIILYIVDIIIEWLLSIMEWWVLFALFVIITTPIILGIALLMATSSNDEVYNLK